MRILITGIEGFCGTHLAGYCLSRGDEVWGTVLAGGSAESLGHLTERLTLRVGSITDSEFVASILQEHRFDAICHLAAISFVPEAEANPKRTYDVNLMGGIHLLEAVRRIAPETKLLLVSSAEVYGRVGENDLPIREQCPLKPANIGAACKAALELASKPYSVSYGCHVVIARSFNHAGPGQGPQFVCSNFAEQIARIEAGQQPPVVKVGDLSAKRDFTDVRDIARGYRMLLEKGTSGEVYNLACGKSCQISWMLEYLVSLARIKVKVEVDPSRVRPIEVKEIVGSNEKIKKEIGWEHEIKFEKTLKDLLNWHRDRLYKAFGDRKLPAVPQVKGL